MNVLRLVRNGRLYYVASLRDYKVLIEMGVPIVKIDTDTMPLLRRRCKKYKVKIETRLFVDLESATHQKIKKKWPFAFAVGKSSLIVEAPKGQPNFDKAEALVEALSSYYERHLYDVEVAVRRFATKTRFTIERKFNEQKSPEWKEAPGGDQHRSE